MPPEREEGRGASSYTQPRSSLSRVRADLRLETQRQEGEGSRRAGFSEAPWISGEAGQSRRRCGAHRSLLGCLGMSSPRI